MSGTGEAGFFGEIPDVKHTSNRTHCEKCKQPVHPNVMHKCGEREIPVVNPQNVKDVGGDE